MPETVIFDSAVAGFALDGTKTLVQLALTDEGTVATVNATGLHIAGVGSGYAHDYVYPSGQNLLYPHVTGTLDPSTLAGATALICLRHNATTGAGYFLALTPTGSGLYIYDGTTFYQGSLTFSVTPNPVSLSGPTQFDVATSPGLGGSLNIALTYTDGMYARNWLAYNDLGGPTAAGLAGVGAFGGTATFTTLRVASNTAAPLALAANEILYLGDSITFGYSTTNAPVTAHPALDGAAWGTAWDVKNQGLCGSQAINVLTNFPIFYVPHLAQAYTKKIVVLQSGTNDLAVGTTAATVVQTLTSIVSAAKAGGATKVYIGTLTPRTEAGFLSSINAVNASIRSGATGADRVIDYAAVPGLLDPNGPNYSADHLHPNNAGQALMSAADLAAFALDFAPSPSSAAVSADGKTVALALSLPATGPGVGNDFVLSNAAGVSASALSADGLTLTLTLRRRVFVGENPTLTYAGTDVVGVKQLPMQALAASAVTNGSTRRAFGPPAFLNVAYPGFTWPTVAGATGYRLYQNGILVYDTVNAAGVNTATSFTDPTATDGRPIDQPTFTVSAYDATGEGPQSGTADGTAAALFTQGTTSVTLTDGAVVNGQTVRLSGPQRVVVNDVRYDVPVGVPVLLPNSIKSVLQNANLIA